VVKKPNICLYQKVHTAFCEYTIKICGTRIQLSHS